LGEGEGTMTKEEFNKMKQELEAWVLCIEYLQVSCKWILIYGADMRGLGYGPVVYFCEHCINMFTSASLGGSWIAGPAIFSIILSLYYIFSKCNLWINYNNYFRMYIKGPSNVLRHDTCHTFQRGGENRFVWPIVFYDYGYICKLGQNKAIWPWSCIDANVLVGISWPAKWLSTFQGRLDSSRMHHLTLICFMQF
jgi:hypothetical protein